MQNTTIHSVSTRSVSSNTASRPIRAATPYKRRVTNRHLLRRFAWVGTLIFVLGFWQLATMLNWVSVFTLPPPAAVAERFYDLAIDGRLWQHTWTTLLAVVAGLGAGLAVGVTLGYLIAKSTLLEDILSPIIVAFQSTPIIAYAPILIILFGSGIESKIITCALIVFFPMMMNTIVGIRSVPSELHDLMRVSQANHWQTLRKLEIPAALPVLLTGLKTSATLAVIGAVVGEFVASNAGLGFLIKLGSGTFDTALIYVGVITLAVMAGALYAFVSVLQKRLLHWQR